MSLFKKLFSRTPSIVQLVSELTGPKWYDAAENLPELSLQKQKELVTALLEILSNKQQEDKHFVTIHALGRLKHPDAVGPLICSLTDKEWNIRGAAAEALGMIRDTKAVEPLAEMLLLESNQGAKAYAIIALSEIGDRRAVGVLIKKLGDYDSYIGAKAVDALEKLGGDEAIQGLIRNIHQNVIVSTRIVNVLGRLTIINTQDQVRRLTTKSAFQKEDVYNFHYLNVTAAWALGRFGYSEEATKLLVEKISLFTNNYQNCDPDSFKGAYGAIIPQEVVRNIRSRIVEVLGEVGDSQAYEALQKLKAREAYQPICKKIDEALTSLKNRNVPNEPTSDNQLSQPIKLETSSSVTERTQTPLPLIAPNTQEKSNQTISYNPFIFRNGKEAHTIFDLLNLCELYIDDANYHLQEGHFKSWLLYIQEHKLEFFTHVLMHDTANLEASERVRKFIDMVRCEVASRQRDGNEVSSLIHDKSMTNQPEISLHHQDDSNNQIRFLESRHIENRTYEIYEARSAAAARRFLESKQVTEKLHYITVETPEGDWGIDVDGLYLEKLLPFQYNILEASCDGSICGMPSLSGLGYAKDGFGDNFVVEVKCGNCDHEWSDGVRYKQSTVVRCPSCCTLNRVDTSKHIVEIGATVAFRVEM